jgi:hypothetical protein
MKTSCSGVSDLHAVVHADQHAFVGEGGVEAGEHFLAALEAAAKEAQRLVTGVERRGERLHLHAGRQCRQVAQRLGRAAVDEHQAWRGDVGQQGGVHRRRRQRCRAEAAAFQLAQRGVFPGFGTRAGQAGLQGGIQFSATGVAAVEASGEGIEQSAHQTAASGTTRSFRKW